MPFDPWGVLMSCIEGMILWQLEKQRDLFYILFWHLYARRSESLEITISV